MVIMTWQEQLIRHRKKMSREMTLLRFFGVLFFIVICRLFYLQVVQGWYYSEILAGQHLTASRLQAERWQIFVTDRGWTELQLTENVEFFNVFIDPKFVNTDQQKEWIIDVLTPITYEHLCLENGIDTPDTIWCLENLEWFLRQDILPDEDSFYTFSGDALLFVNTEDYDEELEEIIDEMSPERAQRLIQNRYQQLIQWWIKSRNYLTSVDDEELKNVLREDPYQTYIDIVSDQFVYVRPWSIQEPDRATTQLENLFASFWIELNQWRIRASMQPQEIRYVKLLDGLNAKLTKKIKDAKNDTAREFYEGTPLLHGIWLETTRERYYPHGGLMAHILGYLDNNDNAFYWIEEYFDKELRWVDWEIVWLATPWIWQIGANNFDIRQPKDWSDIYLTVDPVIQKEVESTIEWYREAFYADSIAVTVIDPHTWKVKAMANAPSFNPNEYQQAFQIRPIEYEERDILDDETYIDIPVYTLSWDSLIRTTTEERNSPGRKYIFNNYLWPQVFVDKNISFPYEPWSIVKALTLAIGIDANAINLYDYYDDEEGSVEVWQFTIANIEEECTGTHTFKFALAYSCNVWMVRIAQAMSKYVFYSYMKKLWFWEDPSIELANAESWTLPDYNIASRARFFNNTYWQWFLATPLQMASAYSALVNWGYYIKPTVVEAMFDPNTNKYIPIQEKEKIKVFTDETSLDSIDWLMGVFETWNLGKYEIEWVTLGWKTWTSEISFRWQYQSWNWRTNGSFVWTVTWENPRYVIAIQVRRPRTSPRWADTAWAIFWQLAQFLVAYDTLEY